jgi:hypothetical protein
MTMAHNHAKTGCTIQTKRKCGLVEHKSHTDACGPIGMECRYGGLHTHDGSCMLQVWSCGESL